MELMGFTGPAIVFWRSVLARAEPPNDRQPVYIAASTATTATTMMSVFRDSAILVLLKDRGSQRAIYGITIYRSEYSKP